MSGRIDEFQERDCDILGINTDSVATHVRWLTSSPAAGGLGPLEFPLASDEDGQVCSAYGVYMERQNLSQRALFIIDPNGVLQYQVVHNLSVGRSADEVLRVIDALQSGGLCPGEREQGGPLIDLHAELGPNRILGQYEIESEIGRGGFGTVFRAHDQLLDRTVALKVLRDAGNGSTESLLSEARAAAALNHPNVCAVHSIDASSGAPVIVMEFVEGSPLASELEAGPLAPDTVAKFARQTAQGMAAAHQAGVVHGDLKPANLMVTDNGIIKIMDFGLARRTSTTQPDANDDTVELDASSGSSGLSGTLSYMAPELARGEPATPASDTFALGLMIYEMLTGRQAITGNNVLDTLRRVEQFDPAVCIENVPDSFVPLLQGTLARTPSDRLSMTAVVDALAR